MSSDAPLDVEELRRCRLQRWMHIDLARGGTSNVYRCVEFPRLQRVRVRETSRSPETSRWSVDGVEFANLAECCEALHRTREENEAMADERERQAAGMGKWKLADGIAELEHVEQDRSARYPTLIARDGMTQAEANAHNAALAGTLTFLRFCKEHEYALRAFMSQALKAKAEAAAAAKQGELL